MRDNDQVNAITAVIAAGFNMLADQIRESAYYGGRNPVARLDHADYVLPLSDGFYYLVPDDVIQAGDFCRCRSVDDEWADVNISVGEKARDWPTLEFRRLKERMTRDVSKSNVDAAD